MSLRPVYSSNYKTSFPCIQGLYHIFLCQLLSAKEEQYLNQLVMEENYGKKIAQINEEK